MYFIAEGIKQYVYEAYDKELDIYGYVIECDCCGDISFIPEEDFVDAIENGRIEVICEDEGEEECDCEVCRYERGEFDYDDEDDFVDDIREELFELKGEMKYLRDEEMYEEYAHVAQSYALLYRLLL